MARQVKENTQGAPTEGLGQTVTFAPNLAGGTPTTPDVNYGTQRGGVQTIGRGTDLPAPVMLQQAPPDKTIALLAAVANDVTKANIEKMKVEKFVSGMQQAMHGKAISEVAADQPWYATLFGEADAVEGARAYTASAKAATIATTMEERMDKLAEMEPYQAQQYFTQMVTENLTGDKVADSAILQSMTRLLPSVMKTQSKAHIAFQQKRAVAADAAQFEANAALLQAQAARPVYGEQDVLTNQANMDRFFYDQVPPVGVDAENWQEGKTIQMLNAIQHGQFHVVNALMRPDKNILTALKPDQQLRIEKALETGQERARSRWRPEYASDITKIHLMAAHMPEGKTAEDLALQIDTLNLKYQNSTGSSIGLISTDQRTSLITHGYNGIMREQEARQRKIDAAAAVATKASDKADLEAQKQTLIKEALAKGTVSQLVASKKIGNEDIYPVAVAEYNTQTNMPDRIEYLAGLYRDKFVVSPISDAKDGSIGVAIRDNIQNGFVGALPALYAEWNVMYERDPAMTASYYPTYGPRMLAFKKALENQHSEMEAWKISGEAKDRKVIAKPLMDLVSKEVGSQSTSLFSSRMTEGSIKAVSKVAAPLAERYATQMGDKAAAEMAVKVAVQEGRIEIMGSHGWSRYHDDQRPAYDWWTKNTTANGASIPTDKVRDFVSDYFDQRIRAIGAEPSSSVIFRAPDKADGDKTKNVPVFLIQGYKNGTPMVPIMVDGEDIRREYHKKPVQQAIPDPLGA